MRQFVIGLCLALCVMSAGAVVAGTISCPARHRSLFFANSEDSGLASTTGVFVGVVRAVPASGPVGKWKIGEKTFYVTSDSKIDEGNGPVTVGATVKVTYEQSGEKIVVRQIETTN